ncbi:MAG: ABC transporter permease subunit [Chloroflexi bacterium]|nr:ABC transporter permease subunit [Chloroflexota bacterium]
MNWRVIRAIMRKDLKQVLQNRMVWLPMVLVPALILVILPAVLVSIPAFVPTDDLDIDDLDILLQQLPATLREPLEGLSPVQQYVVLSANYMFSPMFLIVPLMVASILAADSVAGEKERRTLEGLLYTPTNDGELFLAKVLAAFLPALVIGVAAFGVSAIVVNAAGYRIMGRLFFPVVIWWPLVFWMGPAVSMVGLGATVLISSKAKTFMQAQQFSGILVLPIVFLMIAQVSGLFFLGVGLILALGLLLWVIGLALVWIGARTFARGEIIARI